MTTSLTFKQIEPFIKSSILANKTPLLLGMPGIGKSSFVENLSKTMKTKVFSLAVNQLADRADLTGARLVLNEDSKKYEQQFFPHAIINQAIDYAENNPKELVILFLDEINRASADITSAILSFVTSRQCGTIKFPDNIRFVTAGNDKGNVVSLDDASLSRFSLWKVEPDIQTYIAVNPTLNPFILETLNKFPADLTAEPLQMVTEDNEDDDDISDSIDDILNAEGEGFAQITTPRTISYLSDFLNNCGLDKSGSDEELEFLKESILDMSKSNSEVTVLMTALQSYVGYTSFTEHLFNVISGYYQTLLETGTIGSANAVSDPLAKYIPEQDVINSLHYASETKEVEDIVNNLDETKQKSLLLWCMSTGARTEVDNNDSFNSAITMLLPSVKNLTKNEITDFTNMILSTNNIDDVVMKALKESSYEGCARLTSIAETLSSIN